MLLRKIARLDRGRERTALHHRQDLGAHRLVRASGASPSSVSFEISGGVARYSLEIKRTASREIENLPTKKERRLVVDRITKLADDPRPPGSEKLVNDDRYRVRQGQYRRFKQNGVA